MFSFFFKKKANDEHENPPRFPTKTGLPSDILNLGSLYFLSNELAASVE